jgi:hypothetical protein
LTAVKWNGVPMSLDPRTPLLVGAGQVNQRTEQPDTEPVDLMTQAAREAADPRVLEAVDSIRVVNLLSWRYRDPGLLVGQRIGAADARTQYTGNGGNTPQSLVNQTCLDIRQGRADVVLLTGGETWRTRMRLRAKGIRPDWSRQGESVPVPPGAGTDVPMVWPADQRIGLDRPSFVYPLFEEALRIARRPVGPVQRGRCREPERLGARCVDRRADHPTGPGQPDDQLALPETDELQQHGESGCRAGVVLVGKGRVPADPA